jgi:hypothetical protein
LADLADRFDKYRSEILNPDCFNLVALGDAFTWRVHEEWGSDLVQAAVVQCRAKGMKVHGHGLYTPAFRWAPPRCRQMPPEDLLQNWRTFIEEQSRLYRDKVEQWAVVHAPLTYQEVYDLVGEQSMVQAYHACHQGAPQARLYLSDDRALTSPMSDYVDELIAVVRWLRAQGAPVQGLALQARLGRPHLAPKAIEARLDRLARDTGMPILVTGLSVEAPTEDLQAARLEDMMLLFYSHPGVTGLILEDPWEATAPEGAAPLFRRNFAVNPAGKAVRRVLGEAWRTRAEGRTDATGAFTVTGHLGTYTVRVESGAVRIEKTVLLGRGGTELPVAMAPARP